MATLFKPTRTYPLPSKAEIIDKGGRLHVRIKDGGKFSLYPISKDRTKYLKRTAKWYAKYRDANNSILVAPLSPTDPQVSKAIPAGVGIVACSG